MSLDFRAIRLRTRQEQEFADDLPTNVVDEVVRLTRSEPSLGTKVRRSIAVRKSTDVTEDCDANPT